MFKPYFATLSLSVLFVLHRLPHQLFFHGYPAVIKRGKHPIELEVLIGTSTIRGGFSIVTFDCQKVL
jgi:hypothetical protein